MAIHSTVTLAEQKMKDGSTKLELVSPFVPGFSDQARAVGGVWNADTKAWYFDTRDARRVADLCIGTWGIDPLAAPDDAPELVTVRIDADDYADEFAPGYNGDTLHLFGRAIAARGRRDRRLVRFGDGVIKVSSAPDGTIVEIRDIPRPAVDQLAADRRRRADQAEAEADGLDARAEREGGYLADSYRRNAESRREKARHLRAPIAVVETVPAADRVPPAMDQIVALAKTLGSAGRRQAVLSIVASMDGADRRALLAEIERYRDQDAI